MSEYYIGIMSGTSLDGVDVALCRIDAQECILEASYEHPFPSRLKEEILHTLSASVTLQQIGSLDHRLGALFAKAAAHLLEKEKIDPHTVTAIGLHGQTLWHEPQGSAPFTMQLGDPTLIAARTGIDVVSDLRRMNMAYGGSGAPLAPAFHRFIFQNIKSPFAVVNMGGIANITLLGEETIGYDTGPGNMLMDAWISKHKGIGYDKEGAWAREGEVDYTLLDTMMNDPYFAQPIPKSTGREKFNLEWLESIQHLAFGVEKVIQPVDIQRTLLELTALSISNEVLKYAPDILMLCGGGAQNSFLVERIAALMPNVQVGVMEHADMLEAMMMAWLAYKRVHKEPVILKDVTGARKDAILGALYIA